MCVTGRRSARLLEPTASLESCQLGHVFFAYDSAQIPPEDQPWLDYDIRCARYLKLPSLVLEGHADARGDPDYNHALSDCRAEAVGAYLREHGLEIPVVIRPRGAPPPQQAPQRAVDERQFAWQRRVELLVK